MRRLLIVVAAVVVASCARTVNVEQEKTALLAVDAEWSKNARDFEKYITAYAPNATMKFGAAPAMSGVQAIRAGLEPLSKATGFDASWQPARADVTSSGDLGYTTGSYAVTVNNAAGMPATEKGTYLTVWKKIDGAWKAIESSGSSDAPTPISSPHLVLPASAVKWIDPPPSVPPGAKMAAISGDPSKPEPFTIRLQLPAGYTLAPHWHPTDEHVSVLSGTFSAAMGKAFDDKALADLPAGSYAVMAATMPHFARAKTATTLQVHGMGPFVVNYVNPADAPAAKK